MCSGHNLYLFLLRSLTVTLTQGVHTDWKVGKAGNRSFLKLCLERLETSTVAAIKS